jgi:predicted nucleic acid-binding protein
MKRFVVDASAVVKLFIREDHSEACEKKVNNTQLFAPDLLWVESAGVLRKKVNGKEITAQDATNIMLEMLRLPVDTYPSWSLVRRALLISLETGRSVYDCMYIALAIEQDCKVLTADERLCNALSNTPYARYLQFVEKGEVA